MKQGKTLPQLAQELDRQQKVRKDLIADTSTLTLQTDQNGQSLMQIDFGKTIESFGVEETAHRQIASRLQIPYKYYERLRKYFSELLDHNINKWFRKEPERRMLRTLDGNVRAFLSDRYRRIDNLEIAEAVFPIIAQMKGAEIMSCEITQTHLYIKIVNHGLKADLGVNDIVKAGIVISNNEIGLGSFRVEPLIYRLACKNGLIIREYSKKHYHVGKQIAGEDPAYEIYSDATINADDKAFFMKVQDTVRTAVDEVQFLMAIGNFKESKKIMLDADPDKTVKILTDRYTLNRVEQTSILHHLIALDDNTMFGLINAVTRASQDIADYDRATELERIGGMLISTPLIISKSA